jgi:hypothetical protein
MNKQHRNDQRSPSPEDARRNAGRVDDIEEGNERVEDDQPGQPGGGRQSGSETPSSPDSRWAPRRNS